jgi:hypothetical protein
MNESNFECVIMTTTSQGTPHLEALVAANPGLKIHIATGPDPVDETAREMAWKNCDRNLRDWWREHAAEVATERVLFLEWDVFVNADLAAMLPGGKGMFCARLKMPVADRGWSGFKELNKLPREIRGFGVGTEPMAALMVSREVLDEVAGSEWDGLFQTDILSELRMGTVARFRGHKVAGWEPWKDTIRMTPTRVPEGFSGMLHPVKKEVLP